MLVRVRPGAPVQRHGRNRFERPNPLHQWVADRIDAARRASAPISSTDLGVTYKTAWFLAHRIREACELPPWAAWASGAGRRNLLRQHQQAREALQEGPQPESGVVALVNPALVRPAPSTSRQHPPTNVHRGTHTDESNLYRQRATQDGCIPPRVRQQGRLHHEQRRKLFRHLQKGNGRRVSFLR